MKTTTSSPNEFVSELCPNCRKRIHPTTTLLADLLKLSSMADTLPPTPPPPRRRYSPSNRGHELPSLDPSLPLPLWPLQVIERELFRERQISSMKVRALRAPRRRELAHSPVLTLVNQETHSPQVAPVVARPASPEGTLPCALSPATKSCSPVAATASRRRATAPRASTPASCSLAAEATA